MRFKRSAGILLHPTSLPGQYGIGDLGPQAHLWLEFLASAGCGLWQILPLGPTGYGDSPYQCFSAFAGNTFLISPEMLFEDGLIDGQDLEAMPVMPPDRVDFGAVIPWKQALFRAAFTRFTQERRHPLHSAFEAFKEEQAYWLEDFCLFMALKDAHQGAPWIDWEEEYRQRHASALKTIKKQLAVEIEAYAFQQFLFFKQWDALKAHAARLKVHIIGDIPIFVAHDSADVWAYPHLFQLTEAGAPKVVAGVPPDYFSPTGQLWGNPLYAWEAHQQEGYDWWLKRFKAVLHMVDIVRLDHFRGFAAYWEVPGGMTTAEKGRWVPAPGEDFLTKLQQTLGDLPIIAEDLGVITEDVIALREKFDLPGMKILQFAFEGDPQDPFLPHHYSRHCVAYTGTHDNDTAWGWYQRVNEKSREFYRRYLHVSGEDVAWDMIRAAWMSVAVFAIAPLQDFLNLGNEARMNYPGSLGGNWTWRVTLGELRDELAHRIFELNYLYSRL